MASPNLLVLALAGVLGSGPAGPSVSVSGRPVSGPGARPVSTPTSPGGQAEELGGGRSGEGDGAPAPEIFRMERLADGVWAALVVERPDAYAFANSLVVLGDDGVLVVDTQQSPTAAGALVAWIRERTDAPVRWVVNTHWHGDHVYGNQAYRQAFPDVRFVGHARLPEALAGPGAEGLADDRARIPELVERRRKALDVGRGPDGEPLSDEERSRLRYSLRVNRTQAADLEGLELVPPDVTVADEHRLRVGGRPVRVLAVARAHTGTDLVVHLPEDGVVAVGDLLEEGLPWVGEEADPAGWARALERIAALEPDLVLPAHGGVQRDGTLLAAQRALFGALARRVSEAVEEGAGLAETRASVRLDDVRPPGLGGGAPADEAWRRWVEGAVERAWRATRSGG